MPWPLVVTALVEQVAARPAGNSLVLHQAFLSNQRWTHALTRMVYILKDVEVVLQSDLCTDQMDQPEANAANQMKCAQLSAALLQDGMVMPRYYPLFTPDFLLFAVHCLCARWLT